MNPTVPAEFRFDSSAFLSRHGAGLRRNRPLKRLAALISVINEDTELGVEWIEDLLGWIFERDRSVGRIDGESEIDARTHAIITALEEIPTFSERVRNVLRAFIDTNSSTELFTSAGIATSFSFGREFFDRVMQHLLPNPPMNRDLSRFIPRLFSKSDTISWAISMPLSTRTRLLSLLGLTDETIERALNPGLKEALVLLAARVAAQGSADEIRHRLASTNRLPTAFLQLPLDVHGLLSGGASIDTVKATVQLCRDLLRQVEGVLEDRGVSVDLVFQLDLLAKLLTRIDLMASILFDVDELAELSRVRLEKDILMGAFADRRLRSLWQTNTQLLARQVVDHAGVSGEKYVTRTRTEQKAMFGAALGGGFVTAFMVLTKFFIGWANSPPLINALAIGFNYSWGFVAMQLLHFALATKQPSMTAATLARAIEVNQRDLNFDEAPLVDIVMRASRTQFTALLGNIFMVVPVCLGIDFCVNFLFGSHLLGHEEADKIIRIHHPFDSGTFYFAAMTGVWLWAASLIAGAVDNWFTLRELRDGLASNRLLRRFFGAERTAHIADFARRHISGLGGNIGFGLLLGVMPFIFFLVGIPLEVRHVTFVMGQLAYAVAAYDHSLWTDAHFYVLLATGVSVGLINFAVSFTLALTVALRARGLGIKSQIALGRAVLRQFWQTPRRFFVAPKEIAASQDTIHQEPSSL